jgi:hypothetical protein
VKRQRFFALPLMSVVLGLRELQQEHRPFAQQAAL